MLLHAACSSGPEADPDAFALRLHRDAIVVDTHSDTTPYFEDASLRFDARHPKTVMHMDLPRIREGGLDAQFWSIYMGRREGRGRAIREALERIDAVHRMVAAHDDVVLATDADGIREAARRGRFASLMGMEGGHIIEGSLAALRSFHRLGVRYLTLTHSFHTAWADSAGTREVPAPLHGGLTPFGEQVVAEMNRLGMMVDVSHVSDDTFFDALAVSAAPVIASHSSCRAVTDHVRNLSDPILRALARNGGVVMINFYSAYIDDAAHAAIEAYYDRHRVALARLADAFPDDWWGLWLARRRFYAAQPLPQAPLGALLDHFDHAIAVAGADHVGIGADWDGVASLPHGLDEVSALPALTRGLLARGHPPAVVRKVLGENLLRVMAEVERTARTLRARAAHVTATSPSGAAAPARARHARRPELASTARRRNAR